MTHAALARLFIAAGRVLLFLSAVALFGAWLSQIRGSPVLGMPQDHLFYDAITLGVLGIGCLVDAMLHAKNL